MEKAEIILKKNIVKINVRKGNNISKEEIEKKILMAYEKGYYEGYSNVEKEKEIILKKIIENKEFFEKIWEKFLSSVKLEIIDTIFFLLEELLQKKIEKGDYCLENIYKKAYEQMSDVNLFEIQHNLEDAEFFKKYFPENIKLIVNNKIPRGDFMLITNLGNFKVSLNDRLEEIKSIFIES